MGNPIFIFNSASLQCLLFKHSFIMKDKTKQFDEILKQFSTGEELTYFLKSLQKRGTEKYIIFV